MKNSIYNVYEEEESGVYISNTLTKSVVFFDTDSRKTFNLLQDNEIEKICDTALIEQLYALGILIDDGVDELQYLEYMYNANMHNSKELSVILLTTLNCNCCCEYCFQHGMGNEMMHEEQFIAIEKYLESVIPKLDTLNLSLFGGEPLLTWERSKQLLDRVINIAQVNNVVVNFSTVTNGTLLDKNTAHEMIEKYHFQMIQFTIDGLSEEKHNHLRKMHDGSGTYQKITSNLRYLLNLVRSANIPSQCIVKLRLNLIDNSLDELDTFLQPWHEYKDIMQLIIRAVFSTSHYQEKNINTKNYFEFIERGKALGFQVYDVIEISKSFRYCEGAGGINIVHVFPDLSIHKCGNHVEVSSGKIGSIDRDGTMKINFVNVVQYHSPHNPFHDQHCRECVMLPMCFGGCPTIYHMSGRHQCTSDPRPIHKILRAAANAE